LSAENVKALAAAMPTPEEEEILTEWKGDGTSSLAKAEQFLLEMLSVPRLKQRLEAYAFTQSFSQIISELREQITAVSSACKELKTSKKFVKLLEVSYPDNMNDMWLTRMIRSFWPLETS